MALSLTTNYLASSTLFEFSKKIIPPLTHELHKGQSGRIAVIGGSEEYTGAPYFSAMSSLKLGADLAHVFCEKKAGVPIKSYSPELIVHPYLQSLEHLKKNNANDVDAKINEIVEKVSAIFPRLHVLVIGPGLSRDQGLITTVEKIIEKAKAVNLPLVIDADGLFIIQNNPDLIKGYKPAILTPNVVEFNRLCDKMKIGNDTTRKYQIASKLSQELGNVTIVQKGSTDLVTNGKTIYTCDTRGSVRRCGGQGDVLSGAIATFYAWGKCYQSKNWSHPEEPAFGSDFDEKIPMLASWAGCYITRNCSCAAFEKYGRSMTATNMVELIGSVFENTFEEKDDKFKKFKNKI